MLLHGLTGTWIRSFARTAPGGRGGRHGWRTAWLACLAAGLLAAGCATRAPMIDDDVNAFTSGVDATIKVGMPFPEAKKALLAKFPRPDEMSEGASLIYIKPTQLLARRNRRFIFLWNTTTPGTKIVLTIECDRDFNVARWIVGPLNSDR